MPLTEGKLSPPWQKGAERARQEEAVDTSRASLGQADGSEGKTTAPNNKY